MTKIGLKLHQRAVKAFGLTEDPREAGFIMADGAMLDFSARRWGERGGRREEDHTIIGEVFYGPRQGRMKGVPHFESGFAKTAWFQDQTDAIRFMPENCAFYIRKPLTSSQEWTVKQILAWIRVAPIVEIDGKGGRRFYREFGDEEPEFILAAIRAFFGGQR